MFLLFIVVIGIAIFDVSFPGTKFLGVPIIYLVMAAMTISYIRFLRSNRGSVKVTRSEKKLLIFIFYGLLLFFISLIGANKLFVSKDLLIKTSYIPRQAYYLFLLPSLILFKDSYYTDRLDIIIKKYGNLIFWCIYLIPMVLFKHFRITLPATIVLCWLTLKLESTNRTIWNLLRMAVCIFTPPYNGGESTNIIIRFVFVLLVLFYNNAGKKLFKYLSISIFLIIGGIYFISFFPNIIPNTSDVNASWRLLYWHDEIVQLSKTMFLGVGYGTSYASVDFVGNTLNIIGGPFGATAEYSTVDKMFVVGCHNSFISVAFRTGIIGISAFICYLVSISRDLLNSKYKVSALSIFSFCAAIILICFNVGLESTGYLIIFILLIGTCNAENNLNYKEYSKNTLLEERRNV